MNASSCSIAEIAAIVGRDRKTKSKWIKEGMPAEGAGVQGSRASINTPAAIAWLLARERNKFNPELSGKNLATERLRLLSEQADREALDVGRY
jgi:phage terminase Nu1 subunit (DNA packaging protein)